MCQSSKDSLRILLQRQSFNIAIISESIYVPFFINQNRLKTYILNIEIDAQLNTNQKFQNVIFSKIHNLLVYLEMKNVIQK